MHELTVILRTRVYTSFNVTYNNYSSFVFCKFLIKKTSILEIRHSIIENNNEVNYYRNSIIIEYVQCQILVLLLSAFSYLELCTVLPRTFFTESFENFFFVVETFSVSLELSSNSRHLSRGISFFLFRLLPLFNIVISQLSELIASSVSNLTRLAGGPLSVTAGNRPGGGGREW